MSKFHLLRLFRQEVGTTPHAYQVHLRVSRAREMLDRGVCAAEVSPRLLSPASGRQRVR